MTDEKQKGEEAALWLKNRFLESRPGTIQRKENGPRRIVLRPLRGGSRNSFRDRSHKTRTCN
jgi:hypothetical protein